MKAAIVTGASGFVGSAVVRELNRQGYQVTAVVRQKDKRSEALENCADVVCCGLDEIDVLPDFVSEREYAAFFHLAWQGSAGDARGDYEIQARNITSACKAVEVAARLNCARFIFAGSIMQYEVQAAAAAQLPLGRNTIYSTAKLTAAYMCNAVSKSRDLPFVNAVISNIYGPGEHSPRLVNTMISQLQRGESVKLTPGEQIYDFIYIDDAARAFCGMAGASIQGDCYIGSQKPRPLREFLEVIGRELHAEDRLCFGAIPFQGISLDYTQLFDLKKLETVSGVTPKVSFPEGIRKTAQWLKEEQHAAV